MADVVIATAVLVLAIGLGSLVWLIRNDRLSRGWINAITFLCAASLYAMFVTDWPFQNMSDFWATHSVLAGVLSSALLVGLVFLVYERGEQQRQAELAHGLSGAGAGGIVDHIVDVEVALALLSAPTDPGGVEPDHWSGWDAPGKPLRWLRRGRDEILNTPKQPERDPRRWPMRPEAPLAPWGQELIDQSIRRILAAMRDWSPLVGASDDGTAALLLLSRIRADLMELHDVYPCETGPQLTKDERKAAAFLVVRLRTRLRILARAFEDWSGAEAPRRELLSDASPLPPVWPGFEGAGRSLASRLEEAARRLNIGTPRRTVDEVRDFVEIAHAGQVDKLGRDYFTCHLIPVAEMLQDTGPEAVMAGLLHDVLEDTPVTAKDLRSVGIPKRVITAVEAVTKRPGESYDDSIRRAAADRLGRLVKLADNAVNLKSNGALASVDPVAAERLRKKYESARSVLERS